MLKIPVEALKDETAWEAFCGAIVASDVSRWRRALALVLWLVLAGLLVPSAVAQDPQAERNLWRSTQGV